MNYLLMVTELKAGTSNFGCTQLVLPHGVGVERSPMWYLPSSCSLPWYHLSSQPSDPISPPSHRGHRAVLGTHPGTARGDGSTASLRAAEGLQRGTEARLCSQRGGEMQQRHSALPYGT